MSRDSADFITSELKAAGLEVSASTDGETWLMSFDVLERKQPVLLTSPTNEGAGEGDYGDYFLAVSFIYSDQLNGPPEALKPALLVAIWKAQAKVLLAKVDYWSSNEKTHYMAVSPCSKEGITGQKLRRRLEACAELAVRVRMALLELAEPPK